MNEFEQLQSDVAARLRSVDYFSNIAVEAVKFYRSGDKVTTPQTINDKLDRVLQGLTPVGDAVGAVVRVLQPVLNVAKPNLPGPQSRIIVPIRVNVHPIINFGAAGTGKYNDEIAIEIVRALHGFGMQYTGGNLFRLIADGDTIVSYFDEEKKFMSSEVLVHTTYQIQPRKELSLPQITVGDENVTLTVTDGSQIYYTVDGTTYPDTNAVEYIGPFVVAPGTLLRWASYRAGTSGSQVGALFIP